MCGLQVEALTSEERTSCSTVREYADLIESKFGFRPTVKALKVILGALREEGR